MFPKLANGFVQSLCHARSESNFACNYFCLPVSVVDSTGKKTTLCEWCSRTENLSFVLVLYWLPCKQRAAEHNGLCKHISLIMFCTTFQRAHI